MLKIAIVGNIASGKSTIEEILIKKGYQVFDTDKIAHEILATSKDVEKEFGTCDRSAIAQIVFSDKDKLKLLESIIHPKVKNELEQILNNEYKEVFVSVPQLFESGMDSMFDKIIYVTADENLRLDRLIKRNSITIEDARKRINAQTEFEKKDKSDFVINNNGSIEDLQIQIEKILSLIFIR